MVLKTCPENFKSKEHMVFFLEFFCTGRWGIKSHYLRILSICVFASYIFWLLSGKLKRGCKTSFISLKATAAYKKIVFVFFWFILMVLGSKRKRHNCERVINIFGWWLRGSSQLVALKLHGHAEGRGLSSGNVTPRKRVTSMKLA